MIQRIFPLALVGVALFAQPSYAQNASGIAAGTTFANSIVSTSPAQMVNPLAVSSAAWNSAATPVAVPANLGAFSNPASDNSTYTSAATLGLTGIGLKTQSNCASYVPGTNPLMDQQCAAVNFMSNNCLPQNTAEKSVLGSVPMASAGSSNCSGTYGQGASKTNFESQFKSSDLIFSTINTAQLTAATTLAAGSTCSTQTVTLTPAQFSTQTCIESNSPIPFGCSQILNTTVLITSSCPSAPNIVGLGPKGFFDVNFGCINAPMGSVTVSINAGSQCHSYGCNSSYYPLTLNFTTGVNSSATKNLAITYKGASWQTTTVSYDTATNAIHIANSSVPTYSCPNGLTPFPIAKNAGKAKSTEYICSASPSCPAGTSTVPYALSPINKLGSPSSTSKTTNFCAAAPSCPSGTLPVPYTYATYKLGKKNPILTTVNVCAAANYEVIPITACFDGTIPFNGSCLSKSAQTTWSDSCTPFEISAGSALPTP